jgi:small conductance mechanosensitive channel
MKKLHELYQNTLELLPQLAIGLLVIFIAIVIAALIRRLVTKRIKPKTKKSASGRFYW